VLFEQLLFWLAAVLAVGGALGVVLINNPFYSVLSLVLHLIALALLFLLLRAEFLAAAQLVVYAGAVMVLYVFVVAYIGGADEPLGAERGLVNVLGPIFAAVLLLELSVAVLGSGLTALDERGAEAGAGFGSPGMIGELLLSRFLVPFEAASFLLLVAAVGAVVLARRRGGLDERGAAQATTVSPARPAQDGGEPADAAPAAGEPPWRATAGTRPRATTSA
jgi:NADH:ubiquinone oxidoreductase subunit 6 (subunit J)